VPRTPAELRTLLADYRREERDDALMQGTAKPRSTAETLIWHAGLIDRGYLDPDPDDAPVSAVEEAVQQRIAAARARVARRRADRATRARRRTYGVAQRHAAKLAHLDSLRTADGTPDPQETDHG
jgi:hypothetical protein